MYTGMVSHLFVASYHSSKCSQLFKPERPYQLFACTTLKLSQAQALISMTPCSWADKKPKPQSMAKQCPFLTVKVKEMSLPQIPSPLSSMEDRLQKLCNYKKGKSVSIEKLHNNPAGPPYSGLAGRDVIDNKPCP